MTEYRYNVVFSLPVFISIMAVNDKWHYPLSKPDQTIRVPYYEMFDTATFDHVRGIVTVVTSPRPGLPKMIEISALSYRRIL